MKYHRKLFRFFCFIQQNKPCLWKQCYIIPINCCKVGAVLAPNLLLSFNLVEGGEANQLFLEGARAILRTSIDFSMAWSPSGAALGTWKHDSTKNGVEPAASQAFKWELNLTFISSALGWHVSGCIAQGCLHTGSNYWMIMSISVALTAPRRGRWFECKMTDVFHVSKSWWCLRVP